jgi:hypothetical protein
MRWFQICGCGASKHESMVAQYVDVLAQCEDVVLSIGLW